VRIVCFHLNQVGDLLFSLPALKCLRDHFCDAEIASVARPGHAEVLASACIVDRVIPRGPGLNLAKLAMIHDLVKAGFDLAVVFSQSAECAVLSWLTRAPCRVGFVNTSLGFLLTDQVEFKHPPSNENNLRLVRALGCEITCRDYSGLLKPTENQIARAERILTQNGIDLAKPIAALSPGTSGRRNVKEWTDEGFARVGRHMLDRGVQVVIVGSEPASGIVSLESRIVDLSGCTDLAEAMAILRKSTVVVAVDSGVLHLAAAVGTIVVGLYGPSDPIITGPQGSGHVVLTSGAECSPCTKTTCSTSRRCMTDLKPERVIEAVDSLLEEVTLL
jgi:lipopolysaccharide heptosyltransferase II